MNHLLMRVYNHQLEFQVKFLLFVIVIIYHVLFDRYYINEILQVGNKARNPNYVLIHCCLNS